jgi:hypothetical protein
LLLPDKIHRTRRYRTHASDDEIVYRYSTRMAGPDVSTRGYCVLRKFKPKLYGAAGHARQLEANMLQTA